MDYVTTYVNEVEMSSVTTGIAQSGEEAQRTLLLSTMT